MKCDVYKARCSLIYRSRNNKLKSPRCFACIVVALSSSYLYEGTASTYHSHISSKQKGLNISIWWSPLSLSFYTSVNVGISQSWLIIALPIVGTNSRIFATKVVVWLIVSLYHVFNIKLLHIINFVVSTWTEHFSPSICARMVSLYWMLHLGIEDRLLMLMMIPHSTIIIIFWN